LAHISSISADQTLSKGRDTEYDVRPRWIGDNIPVPLDRAGWYADPRERFHGRYFDGDQWTASVCSESLEPTIDPLGIAADAGGDGVEIDDQIAADVHAAQRFAVHDQELIQRAQQRVEDPGASRWLTPPWKGPSPTPRTQARRARLARVVLLTIASLVILTWWGARGDDDLAVVTAVDEPALDDAASIPTLLTFSEEQTEVAMRQRVDPALVDAEPACVASSGIVEVRQPAPVGSGRYRAELCGPVLRFTPVASGAAASIDLVVGEAAVLLPDGVIVSWAPSGDSAQADVIDSPAWDITFWGGDDNQMQTIRARAVIDDNGVARPPVPLPGGYVVSIPVDQLSRGEIVIERPPAFAASATSIADA